MAGITQRRLGRSKRAREIHQVAAIGGQRVDAGAAFGAHHIEEIFDRTRGASINTLSAYRRDLMDFAGALATSKTTLRDASHAEVKRYLALLGSSGIAPSSQARQLSALRQLYGFLYNEAVSYTHLTLPT